MTSLRPPAFEDEASLFSLANEFLEAAEILARSPPDKLNVSLVTLYLLGHAAELQLKCLLHKHGVPLADLKDATKYGHDLAKLVGQARKSGLITSDLLLSVETFSKNYTPKHTEYRQKVSTSLPPVDSLLQELRGLQGQVFNHVAQFQDGD